MKLAFHSLRNKLTPDEIIKSPILLLERQKIAVKLMGGRNILDIECLFGDVSAELAHRNPTSEIVAIDIYNEYLEICRKRFEDIQNLRFSCKSVYNMKFKDEYFDCITFLEVIEHLTNPVAALSEINRILKLGGKLILSTYNVYYWKYWIKLILGKCNMSMYDENVEWARHIYCWNLDTLHTLLKEYGFEVKKWYFVGSGLFSDITSISRICEKIFNKLFSKFGNTMILECYKVKTAQNKVI